MFSFRRSHSTDASGLLTSRLVDEKEFYPYLLKDLTNCSQELIIESPFITTKRAYSLLPMIKKLRKRGVRVVINTRDPQEHEYEYRLQAEEIIGKLIRLGAVVLYTGGLHRKIVIIDRLILWEGSINVLSQYDSCELMRRTVSNLLAQQMIDFLRINKFLVQ